MNQSLIRIIALFLVFSYENASWSKPVEIVAGRDMTCVRHDSGAVDCWGPWLALEKDPSFNCELGECNRPISLMDGMTEKAKALQMATFDDQLCVLTQGKTLECWSSDRKNSYDLGAETDLTSIRGIRMSLEASAIVLSNQQLACRQDEPLAKISISNLGNEKVLRVFDGMRRTCYLTEKRVICSKVEKEDLLGDHTQSVKDSESEMDMYGLSENFDEKTLGLSGPIKDVAVGLSHLCVLSSKDELKCIGDNSNGQSGAYAAEYEKNEDGADYMYPTGGAASRSTQEVAKNPPVVVENGLKVTRIWAKYNETCAKLSNNMVKCFGQNLGNRFQYMALSEDEVVRGESYPLDDERNIPLRVGRNKAIQELAIGPLHMCAIISDGTVRCWGSTGGGRLGSTVRRNPLWGDKENERGDSLKIVHFPGDALSSSATGPAQGEGK